MNREVLFLFWQFAKENPMKTQYQFVTCQKGITGNDLFKNENSMKKIYFPIF